MNLSATKLIHRVVRSRVIRQRLPLAKYTKAYMLDLSFSMQGRGKRRKLQMIEFWKATSKGGSAKDLTHLRSVGSELDDSASK